MSGVRGEVAKCFPRNISEVCHAKQKVCSDQRHRPRKEKNEAQMAIMFKKLPGRTAPANVHHRPTESSLALSHLAKLNGNFVNPAGQPTHDDSDRKLCPRTTFDGEEHCEY